jgi:apolipoprotein D and lipocalin family protein
MKNKIYFLIILFLSTTLSIGQEMQNEPKVVKYVDLKKYTSLWYEIAKIPNRFQKHCKSGTTAKYDLRDDGKIEVINSCIDEDGERDDAEGIARLVDAFSNAKLEVSFVSVLGINLFWGDYWIIGLGNEYEYAVVGTPTRKYGWILSRTPKLSDEKLKEAFEILKSQGYEPKKFEMTIQ